MLPDECQNEVSSYFRTRSEFNKIEMSPNKNYFPYSRIPKTPMWLFVSVENKNYYYSMNAALQTLGFPVEPDVNMTRAR
jgi:hypothetical protein